MKKANGRYMNVVCCYYKSANVADFVLPDFCCDEWRENK